jgi:hypothetical protein
MRRLVIAAPLVLGLLAGCASSPNPTVTPATTLTLVAGSQRYSLAGGATSLCFVFRDALGDEVYITRRLSAGGYLVEGTLIPFKPPGAFTNFTTKLPSVSGGQLLVADVDSTGLSRNSQDYIAASGSMAVTWGPYNTMSWYADLRLVAFEAGPGPATAHLTGPFTCTVYHTRPRYAPTSPTAVPASPIPDEPPPTPLATPLP